MKWIKCIILGIFIGFASWLVIEWYDWRLILILFLFMLIHNIDKHWN